MTKVTSIKSIFHMLLISYIDMKTHLNLKIYANFLNHKYNLEKIAINAEEIKDQVSETLTRAIINASTQPNLGIIPFKEMLIKDSATLSFRVNRTDRMGAVNVLVDSLEVNNPELLTKYQALPGQVQSYLDRYPEVFPTKLNGDTVNYSNFSTILNF